jgi:hypothetical protein
MVNLIGVHGKIGNGKDTVGNFIVELTKPANGLPSYDQFVIKKYASKLKLVASLLLGVPVEKFEDAEFKKQHLPPEWDYLFGYSNAKTTRISAEGHREFMGDRVKRYTYREFLQLLGTDAMRDVIHSETWINALFADYKPYAVFGNTKIVFDSNDLANQVVVSSKGSHHNGEKSVAKYPNWVITDVRFPNEAEAIKKRGGKVISVVRPGHMDTGNHPSETALDGYNFDYVMYNDGSLESLKNLTKLILQQWQIIT